MSYENWKNKAQGFQTVDVRHKKKNIQGTCAGNETHRKNSSIHILSEYKKIAN